MGLEMGLVNLGLSSGIYIRVNLYGESRSIPSQKKCTFTIFINFPKKKKKDMDGKLTSIDGEVEARACWRCEYTMVRERERSRQLVNSEKEGEVEVVGR